MAGSLLPQPKQTFTDDAGKPLSGGQIYTYAAGSLTPKATYQDQALTIANTNPVIANARGEVVLYGSGAYRVILKDKKGSVVWDRDNVESPSSTVSTGVSAVSAALAASGGAALVGFLQTSAASAGALARTLEDKGRDIISVRDFGAKGDGIADDTAAIQLAINYANNTARKGVFLPGGDYKVTSTITLGSGTLRGEGAAADSSSSPFSRLVAGTVGMTVLTCDSFSRLENFAIQGNENANIGVKWVGGARPYAANIEVVRCRKGSFVFAKTQNGTFINMCSRFSVRAFVLANGARNNNFFNCTSETNVAYYPAAGLGVPFDNTCLIEYVIDENDADYGGVGVTAAGNDRNNWFGGIHERSPCALRFSNLSGYALEQCETTSFYSVEFTPGEGTAPSGVLDTSSGFPNMVRFDGCSFILQSQTVPFSSGANGTVRFTDGCTFSGANNLPLRGISQKSNYISLFYIDTSKTAPNLNPDGGGSYAYDDATGIISMTSGTLGQGFALTPATHGSISNPLALNNVPGPKGFTAKATFTITEIIGGNPALVNVPMSGSPYRRQVGSYATPGTYELLINYGQNPLDSFGLTFTNNGNTSVKVKNVTVKPLGL